VIAPAERYIIDVYASTAWERSIMNQMNEWNYPLGTIVVSDEEVEVSYVDQFNELRSNEWVIADIDLYREYFDKPIDKTMNLDVEMDGMMDGMMWWMMGMGHGHAWWGHGDDGHDDTIALPGWLTLDPWTIERKDEMAKMNEASTTDNTRWYLVDKDTWERNMDIKRTFNQWDKVKIRIYNDPESVHPMQHPIHFHGQRFLVLNKNWEENKNLVWKDTTLVPTGEYVDILVDMSNPWKRMVHCHIAEHLTAWMMMHFMVKSIEETN
jgi:FtsP/CotA-like multicopper oxidase with cupredoxin domain